MASVHTDVVLFFYLVPLILPGEYSEVESGENAEGRHDEDHGPQDGEGPHPVNLDGPKRVVNLGQNSSNAGMYGGQREDVRRIASLLNNITITLMYSQKH